LLLQSKELAAHNKSLPERVEVLMRRKKSKLDKIRHEKAQSELAEATFKPVINPRRPATAAAALQHHGEDGDRGVGHLLQYVREATAQGGGASRPHGSVPPPPSPLAGGGQAPPGAAAQAAPP